MEVEDQPGDSPAAEAVRTVWEKRRPQTESRIEVLEDVTAALVEGRLDADLREAGIEAAHKLSGSLGSFGFPRGSELAFQAEALLGRGDGLVESDALKLAEWVEGMWAEIDRDPSLPAAPSMLPEQEESVAAETNMDVALVEDDEILAELLLHMLRNEGFDPEWINDGGKAAEALAGENPRLFPRVLLLDVDLPAVSGFGVLRAMSESGALERTKVIMLTAHASEVETVKTFELGAFDHVAKPFSLPVLLQRVRRALEE